MGRCFIVLPPSFFLALPLCLIPSLAVRLMSHSFLLFYLCIHSTDPASCGVGIHFISRFNSAFTVSRPPPPGRWGGVLMVIIFLAWPKRLSLLVSN
uniref:Uncharacterized protein n=1 Tax=Anopheles darlingi TaxID=43151 RepID=A0A2M4D7F8_ANODA